VAQRRGRARLERGEIDAELIEAGRIAESLALAAHDHAIVRRRIAVRVSVGSLATSIFGIDDFSSLSSSAKADDR